MEEKVKNHLKALAGLALFFGLSQASATTPVKDWNFLVYLNGVNNLDDFGSLNLNQMEQVGSSDRMNILVQWGSEARPSVDRLYIQKDNDTSKVTSPIVQSLGPADMGSYHSLVDFAKWANDNYPAEHTFIVVWNHGSGWHLAGSPIHLNDISWDDRTGHHITTEELGTAMREIAAATGKKIDIYGSDACLMAMAEVADQMADAVNVFVGSQDLEPGEGWSYATFLAKWQANMRLSPLDVGRLLSADYLAAYNGGVYGSGNRVTMAAYDISKIGAYRNAVRALAKDLASQSAENLAKLKAGAARAKAFFNSDYVDFIDFLNQAGVDALAPASSAAVRAAHANYIVANDQNQDNVTYGLSIWLPTTSADYDQYSSRYAGLTFNQNTSWGAFVKKLNGK